LLVFLIHNTVNKVTVMPIITIFMGIFHKLVVFLQVLLVIINFFHFFSQFILNSFNVFICIRLLTSYLVQILI